MLLDVKKTTITIWVIALALISIYAASAAPGDNLVSYYSFDTRSTNCKLVGGTWYDSKITVGCYGVPAWDTSMCSSTEVLALQNICNSIEETTWSCNAHEVGCTY